jgi:hypothetical protein
MEPLDPLISQLELLSADYPIPDPTWDYAGIWKQVVILQRGSRALMKLLQDTEDATPETDRLVRDYLSAIATAAAQAHAAFPPPIDTP